jgi:hypothetical protein
MTTAATKSYWSLDPTRWNEFNTTNAVVAPTWFCMLDLDIADTQSLLFRLSATNLRPLSEPQIRSELRTALRTPWRSFPLVAHDGAGGLYGTEHDYEEALLSAGADLDDVALYGQMPETFLRDHPTWVKAAKAGAVGGDDDLTLSSDVFTAVHNTSHLVNVFGRDVAEQGREKGFLSTASLRVSGHLYVLDQTNNRIVTMMQAGHEFPLACPTLEFDTPPPQNPFLPASMPNDYTISATATDGTSEADFSAQLRRLSTALRLAGEGRLLFPFNLHLLPPMDTNDPALRDSKLAIGLRMSLQYTIGDAVSQLVTPVVTLPIRAAARSVRLLNELRVTDLEMAHLASATSGYVSHELMNLVEPVAFANAIGYSRPPAEVQQLPSRLFSIIDTLVALLDTAMADADLETAQSIKDTVRAAQTLLADANNTKRNWDEGVAQLLDLQVQILRLVDTANSTVAEALSIQKLTMFREALTQVTAESLKPTLQAARMSLEGTRPLNGTGTSQRLTEGSAKSGGSGSSMSSTTAAIIACSVVGGVIVLVVAGVLVWRARSQQKKAAQENGGRAFQ